MGLMKPRVYLETTVISYLTARPSRDLRTAAHQHATQEWWRERRSEFNLYASQLVFEEAGQGDKAAALERLQILADVTLLAVTEEALTLAETIIGRGVMPAQAAVDAAHIAVATANAMEYLLTWNLKHIANAAVRGRVEALCRHEGYEPPVICTPEELLEDANDG